MVKIHLPILSLALGAGLLSPAAPAGEGSARSNSGNQADEAQLAPKIRATLLAEKDAMREAEIKSNPLTQLTQPGAPVFFRAGVEAVNGVESLSGAAPDQARRDGALRFHQQLYEPGGCLPAESVGRAKPAGPNDAGIRFLADGSEFLLPKFSGASDAALQVIAEFLEIQGSLPVDECER
jgi:hypothetical protein